MSSRLRVVSGLVLLLAAAGCGGDDGPSPDGGGGGDSAGLASYWPEGDAPEAIPVLDVRDEAEEDEDVVVRGRVKDFVDGRAVFTLVDPSLKSCREMEDDACPTPWDYCCIEPSVVAKSTVTVELRGEDGRPLKEGLKGFRGLDHLESLVVRGRLSRDEQGNTTVAATDLWRE